jgi:hypothetical protein
MAKDSTIESLATEQWSFQGWKTPPPSTSFATFVGLQTQSTNQSINTNRNKVMNQLMKLNCSINITISLGSLIVSIEILVVW